MSPEPPGVVRTRFSTVDPDAAHAFIEETYADQLLRVAGPAEDFGYEHRAAVTPGFTMSRMINRVTMLLDVDDFGDLLMVNMVCAGRLGCERSEYDDTRSAGGDVVLVPPTGAFRAVMEDATLDKVVLQRSRVAQYASATCDVDPGEVRVTGLTPVSPGAAGHWRTVVEHVRDDILADPVVTTSAIVIESATRMLSAAFLSTFPNTATASTAEPAARAGVGEAALREAVDYLRSHAAEPVGPADVATVAGVPLRDVDDALRRRRNTTAARELWQARLHGVHQELLDADPDSGSIATVAARWGFRDTATFRAAYARFTRGETPERTLRR